MSGSPNNLSSQQIRDYNQLFLGDHILNDKLKKAAQKASEDNEPLTPFNLSKYSDGDDSLYRSWTQVWTWALSSHPFLLDQNVEATTDPNRGGGGGTYFFNAGGGRKITLFTCAARDNFKVDFVSGSAPSSKPERLSDVLCPDGLGNTPQTKDEWDAKVKKNEFVLEKRKEALEKRKEVLKEELEKRKLGASPNDWDEYFQSQFDLPHGKRFWEIFCTGSEEGLRNALEAQPIQSEGETKEYQDLIQWLLRKKGDYDWIKRHWDALKLPENLVFP